MSPLIRIVVGLLAAASFLPLAACNLTPVQQRIALSPGGMTVSWSTAGDNGQTPTVRYGLQSSQLSLTASGYTLNYVPSPTWFHHVVLSGLKPSTLYYWQVTTPGANSTALLSFTTAPTAGDSKSYVVAVNGDMGLTQMQEGATQRLMRDWVSDGRIDWFMHVGDAGYADDWQEIFGSTYESVQEEWMNKMAGIWTERVYMLGPGNHEASCSEVTPFICPEGQKNFTSYRTRYRMPPPAGSTGVGNMYYSFDYGLVHWVVIDTEVDYPSAPEGPDTYLSSGPFGAQIPWLQADLAQAVQNRKTVPWIVVVGHRPYYSSDQSDTQASSQTAFESIFIENSVDLVFWGHVHWYERLYPVFGNGSVAQTSYAQPPAPVYVISGAAGCVEGHQEMPSSLQPYTAFVDNTHWGLGLLSVESAEKLVWRWYASDTKAEIDSFTLTKAKIN